MLTAGQFAAQRCGFVGLGSLGGPIARRIAAGNFPLQIWDLDSQRYAAFAGTPATVAANLAELGAGSDHIGICVVDDAGVRAVCRALLPVMQHGARIAIHSTISPATCRTIAAEAAARGIHVLDAPTTGIDQAAAAGELTVMIGGDADVVAAARPIFECIGTLILHLGALGEGMKAKLVHNGLVAANLALAHAALEAGAALGVDRNALVRILRSSTADSYGVLLASQLGSPDDFVHGAKLLRKDVGLLQDALPGNPASAQLCAAALPLLCPATSDLAGLAEVPGDG